MTTSPLLLVHGGAHGAWCWEPLLARLDGTAHAVDLPPTAIRRPATRHSSPPELATLTTADWADAVLHEADRLGWDHFVLVGHSLAGLTIPTVARRAPERVRHLVFVSAMIPPEGGSALDAYNPDHHEQALASIDDARPPDSDSEPGAAGLPENLIRTMFCNDMTDEQTRFVLDHCGNEVFGTLTEPVTRAGIPPTIESTYVQLRRDQALPPDTQARMIEMLRASPGNPVSTVELDSGHDVMISHPELLAPVLDDIARRYP